MSESEGIIRVIDTVIDRCGVQMLFSVAVMCHPSTSTPSLFNLFKHFLFFLLLLFCLLSGLPASLPPCLPLPPPCFDCRAIIDGSGSFVTHWGKKITITIIIIVIVMMQLYDISSLWFGGESWIPGVLSHRVGVCICVGVFGYLFRSVCASMAAFWNDATPGMVLANQLRGGIGGKRDSGGFVLGRN